MNAYTLIMDLINTTNLRLLQYIGMLELVSQDAKCKAQEADMDLETIELIRDIESRVDDLRQHITKYCEENAIII